MSEILLAVDPGKEHLAAAFFIGGKLQMLSLIRDRPWLECAQRISQLIPGVDLLVTEGQQVYPGIRRQNPNDLFPLANQVGAVQALVKHRRLLHPLPRQWKGSTKKAVFSERIYRDLTPHERLAFDECTAPKKFKVDLLDAIGLGKWALKQ